MPKGRPTLKARKTAAAKKAGYASSAAQASVTRQYGLVKNEAGKWVKPDAAFLQRQMTAQGWGEDQPVATPVDIGGARWMFGGGPAQFTGQRSDSAKQQPGAAYDATEGQIPYAARGLGKKPRGRGGKSHKKALAEGGVLGTGGGAVTPVDAASFGGPEADAFSPYSQADTVTTNYTRAQGKAYGRGRGEGLLGADKARPDKGELPTEESTVVGGGKKHPGRKATKAAKRKSSPGGKKVTPKERRGIRRAKGK